MKKMGKFDEINDEIKNLEKQLDSKREELKLVCPHEKTVHVYGTTIDGNEFDSHQCLQCNATIK